MPHGERQLDLCAQCETPTWCFPTREGPICGACRVENFFENVLYAPIGFRLLPQVREELRFIYGSVDMETGRRKIRQVYEEWAKKNGKSFWVGGLPLYHLCIEADELMNPAAFGAASARDQAGYVFNAAAQLVNRNSWLKDRLKVLPSTKRILRRDGHGAYIVLSADGDVQDGLEPSLSIKDEFHRWKTKKAETLYHILTAGKISQPEPLDVTITTAGDVYESPLCWQMHMRARQYIEGSVKSDRFHARIFAADEKKLKADPEYWKSREARKDANPSHEDNGGFLKDTEIEAMYEELGETAYKRYHLNIWGQKAERFFPMDAWLKCSTELKPIVGRQCWLGIDLSKNTDLCSLVAVFPEPQDQSIDVLSFFWIPEERVPVIERKVHQDLQKWIREGLLLTTPGPTIQNQAVRDKIDWLASISTVQEICYDPWNAHDFAQSLLDGGYRCVEVRQGPPTLSAPMKWLLARVLEGKVRHGGHEVLNWNADCTTTRADLNGNIAPAKDRLERDGKRIDGISALVTALVRVIVQPWNKKSVYDERGVEVF